MWSGMHVVGKVFQCTSKQLIVPRIALFGEWKSLPNRFVHVPQDRFLFFVLKSNDLRTLCACPIFGTILLPRCMHMRCATVYNNSFSTSKFTDQYR